MSTYREYCNTQKELGEKPLSMKEWAAGRNEPQPGPNDHDSDPEDVATIERVQSLMRTEGGVAAQAEPEPEEEPERMMFHHNSRYHVEVMQAGQKVVINNSIVTIPHRQIEFTENYWVADMLDPQDREKAEWLMQCKEYRAGKIVRVDQILRQPRVEVRTGPRTTGHNTKQQPNPRPAGELSAPLH